MVFEIEKVCGVCGRCFKATHGNAKYCCTKCKKKANYKYVSDKIDVKCIVCGCDYKALKKFATRSDALNVCSVECGSKLYVEFAKEIKETQAKRKHLYGWLINRGWTVAEAREEYINNGK